MKLSDWRWPKLWYKDRPSPFSGAIVSNWNRFWFWSDPKYSRHAVYFEWLWRDFWALHKFVMVGSWHLQGMPEGGPRRPSK